MHPYVVFFISWSVDPSDDPLVCLFEHCVEKRVYVLLQYPASPSFVFVQCWRVPEQIAVLFLGCLFLRSLPIISCNDWICCALGGIR